MTNLIDLVRNKYKIISVIGMSKNAGKTVTLNELIYQAVESGAEKLLGKGDGLIKTIEMRKFERFQGAFLSDEEIERAVERIEGMYESNQLDESILDDYVVSDEEEQAPKPLNLSKKIAMEKQETDFVDEEEDEFNYDRDDGIEPIENISDQEKRVYKYLYRIAIETEDAKIQIPSTRSIRDEVGIKGESLTEVLNELRDHNFLLTEGQGRATTNYLLTGNEGFKVFLMSRIF